MVALSFRAGGGRVQGREREGKACTVWVASALLALALALQLSSGRTGLKAEADFASWKALSCSRASQAFFKPEMWEGLREGGRERRLDEGSAPEREGPRQRRSAGAAEAIPRLHYCKHLPGVSEGVGVGVAAPTLAGPGWVEAAVRSEQPPHPRRAAQPSE